MFMYFKKLCAGTCEYAIIYKLRIYVLSLVKSGYDNHTLHHRPFPLTINLCIICDQLMGTAFGSCRIPDGISYYMVATHIFDNPCKL